MWFIPYQRPKESEPNHGKTDVSELPFAPPCQNQENDMSVNRNRRSVRHYQRVRQRRLLLVFIAAVLSVVIIFALLY